MNFRMNFCNLSPAVPIAIALAAVVGQSANAATLTSVWTYSIDGVGDGSGGIAYDIRGIALSAQSNKILVALTGGMDTISGATVPQARNGNINWGDLFFNFSDGPFNSAQGSLFAVRFASGNDTPLPLGFYANVRTTSVSPANVGYSSLDEYYDHGFERPNSNGEPLPTRSAATQYFGSGSIQNSIASGTRLGDIALLSAADLATLGLDFGPNAGSQTFGFSFDRSLLPAGSFLANVFLECGNDGVAIAAETAAVPEPTTIAGTVLGIAALVGLRRCKQARAAS